MQSDDYKHTLPTPCTITEFMTVARCSKATAYRWVRGVKVPSVKIGKRILIPKAAVLALLTPKPKGRADAV